MNSIVSEITEIAKKNPWERTGRETELLNAWNVIAGEVVINNG